jgi:hypothetical protein
MTACLSEFALDHLMLDGNPTPEAEAHLRECTACQSRREQRRISEEEFERSLATPFWHAVLREHGQRRRRRFVWLGLSSTLAATSALVFLVAHDAGNPPAVHFLAKGAPSLEIHCRRGALTFVMAPGDAVEPGDELRFVPRSTPAQARYIQVASIDGSGTYTPFYPAEFEAQSLPLPSPGQPLEGSIRLDRAPGPERLFFVLSATPLSVSAVREAAQAHVASLRAPGSIQGAEVASGWIVLAKNAPTLP